MVRFLVLVFAGIIVLMFVTGGPNGSGANLFKGFFSGATTFVNTLLGK